MKTLCRGMVSLSSFLNSLALKTSLVIIALLPVVALYQVVARYVFSTPPVWTEEVARYLMVWGALLGGSVAYYMQADPSLFPGQRDKRGWLSVVRALGTIVFVTPILWYCTFGLNGKVSSGYLARLLGRQADTLDMSLFFVGLAIPIAFLFIFIHATAHLFSCMQVQTETTDKTGTSM